MYINSCIHKSASAGAAFAAFAMIDIEFTLKKKVTALYTYGSPRIGSNQFVQAFNKTFVSRSFRIVNTSDIVTSIPFPVALGGFVGGYFSHVDTPVDFTLPSDELEMNHHISTYYKTLLEHKRKFLFWQKSSAHLSHAARQVSFSVEVSQCCYLPIG
jgi:hypothetical protein